MHNLFSSIIASAPERPVKWGGISSHVLGLILADLIQKSEYPWLIVMPNLQQSQRLFDELRFFLPDAARGRLCCFADYETLPYDHFSPHPDIISDRLTTLYRCLTEKAPVVVVALSSLLHRLAPHQILLQQHFAMQVQQVFPRNTLKSLLDRCAYQPVSAVMERGEYTARGAMLDLFPMGANQPYRIEFEDEKIASIRHFDPETQRSLDIVDKISLLPAKEVSLDEARISTFRQKWREKFSGNPLNSPMYEQISRGMPFSGIEYYLPLFFNQLDTAFDYLQPNTRVLFANETAELIQKFWHEVHERYELYQYDVQRPIVSPQELFMTEIEFYTQIKKFCHMRYQSTALNTEVNHYWNANIQSLPELLIDHKALTPLLKLRHYVQSQKEDTFFLFCSESPGRKQMLFELLTAELPGLKILNNFSEFLAKQHKFAVIQAPIEQGFYLPDAQLIIISENDLYGIQAVAQRRRRKEKTNPDVLIKNLAELYVGAPVVHIDHGVGRYCGLQTLTVDGTATEFLVLEYAKEAKLYIPVDSLHVINRYIGSQEHAPLHQLGSDQWQKVRKKAAEKIQDVAAKLLEIYARRAEKIGRACQQPDTVFQAFCQQFPFEETPDQAQAIQDVIADMTQEKVMDRLVCGDVGFGKTEVAMRAAFLAVQNRKQVVVLVPTTLLAQQHYDNFSDRFAEYPVMIELLSRFRTQTDQDMIIKKLAEGKIDILIGTHKLLQKSIRPTNLGLVIIDEEHRFGVQQKEKLKALCADVDILTLTATPIPRTLNMALTGMRDLSLIATPPVGRLSIRTFILEHDKVRIREAMLREILRGGQVFYVHNNVTTIERETRKIAELLPEARVSYAHGQMREKQLERIMSDFYHGKFNILVCTTIIETGIDIPTANTIIIDGADHFGFAQLHQLRGRVGRSHHQAYAYLVIPAEKTLTADAKKRLKAFAALQDLGVGFMLATHDLEIRGAGEILGEEQSGQIQSIGLNLYMDLLDRTIQSLKSGQQFSLEDDFNQETQIDLKIPALIPEEYCPDVHMRLTLYKRIAGCRSSEELDDLHVEFIDRFGLLPSALKTLFQLTSLKLITRQVGIKKISSSAQYIHVEFNKQPNINVDKLLHLLQTQSQRYTFVGPEHIKINVSESNNDNVDALPSTIGLKKVELVQQFIASVV